MFKNFFVLNRLVNEIDEAADGAVIEAIFSQEKQKLILSCSKDSNNFFIEICTSLQDPYFILRTGFKRAKKNTIDFFDSFIKSIITGISISDKDRIIKLVTTKGQLYFTIRGPRTNIYSVSGDLIQSFKKISADNSEKAINDILESNFSNQPVYPQLSFTDSDLMETIKKNYPQINKEMIKEVELRKVSNPNSSYEQLFADTIGEIYNNDFCIFSDENLGKYFLAPASYIQYANLSKTIFKNVNEAISNLLKTRYIHLSAELSQKIIEKYISTELEKTSYKLNNLKARISKGSNEEKYSKFGNLLLINLWKLNKGNESIELEDVYNSNEKIKITLDKKLSPQKNVDYYFDKSRSEKINFEKSKILYDQLLKRYSFLQSKKEKLNSITESKEYEELKKELKIKTENYKNTEENMSDKFKHYLVENKYDVYVGKDSTNNDLLTTRFAKQNDYWFHARSVPGSHVVLRVNNTKEVVPKSVLKKAASLAAYHSKAKTAGVVPVSYTFKKYVIKKKGMDAGKVALLKEEVLLVKPEIPGGCEYMTSDLE
ncbi:MAG: NFACT RNA binding domain-containing protein [Bacteroidota bacterium]|nr:NFACT RNA binding domain-containing protein [Bacteroidota bacterium]